MNKNFSNIVNYGDKIIATLECKGRRLATVNGTGYSSLEGVKRALLELAGHFVGMAIITVRNCTQGWRDVAALATMRPPQGLRCLVPDRSISSPGRHDSH